MGELYLGPSGFTAPYMCLSDVYDRLHLGAGESTIVPDIGKTDCFRKSEASE